ncbi:hypothetical protein E3E31_03055 [Thermococcus sp. M39]|uniref:hypothetical protein n=1 Tax=unclassified Thermococcus TaxID=2627626 RepID=UPI001438A36B|nr:MULTISPECIES: hypothetical protein [unclassified Thermococcus]NJE07511.1 hypothetical protein [Thermococcus sp. M39]NJE12092.1 hypothetical protein [Thermococcus sp. LS2]
MDKEKTIEAIKKHSNYSREIYEMHEESINNAIDNYEQLKENYLNDHSRARIVRIVINEDNDLPLAIEFHKKDDSFKGFSIAIGKPYIKSENNGKSEEQENYEESNG